MSSEKSFSFNRVPSLTVIKNNIELEKTRSRSIQISFRLVIDDVDRSTIVEKTAIIRQMARDIQAVRKSRIRYDRHVLFDCGWDWPRLRAYWRQAADAANALQVDGRGEA